MKSHYSINSIRYDIPLFLGILILIIAYNTTAISLYNNWIAENSLYSHGLLLLPISLYLFFQEWKLIRNQLTIKFRPILTVVLVFLSALWLISETINIQITSQIFFILILTFHIYTLSGIKQGIRLSFPILILLSSVPLWSIFSEPLQTPTAISVDFLLKLTGYTSFQEGYFIHIPEGIFEVGDTCSGLRYQIAAVTTAALYTFFYKFTLKSSIQWIVIASIIAFISNTVRIYIVVLSGHYTYMTHSLLEDHIWLGWIVFAFFFLGYLLILLKFEHKNSTVTATVDSPAGSTSIHNTPPITPLKMSLILFVLIIFSTTGPLINAFLVNSSNDFSFENVKLNPDIKGWNHEQETVELRPNWQTSDLEVLARYSNNSGSVDLFLSTFFEQKQGKELVSDLNFPYDTNQWELVNTHKIDINLNSGQEYTLNESIVTNQYKQKRIIWSLYFIGNRVTHDKLYAKMYGILNYLSGRNIQSVLIISTGIDKDLETSRGLLESFFKQGFIHFRSQLNMLSTAVD
jgi:EpsI family protein